MSRLTTGQQRALYYARKRRRVASHSGPIDVGGVFSILLEDGSYSFLLQDGFFLLMEYTNNSFRLEDGSMLLQENNNFFLMER
jgi:hypothetical protein